MKLPNTLRLLQPKVFLDTLGANQRVDIVGDFAHTVASYLNRNSQTPCLPHKSLKQYLEVPPNIPLPFHDKKSLLILNPIKKLRHLEQCMTQPFLVNSHRFLFPAAISKQQSFASIWSEHFHLPQKEWRQARRCAKKTDVASITILNFSNQNIAISFNLYLAGKGKVALYLDNKRHVFEATSKPQSFAFNETVESTDIVNQITLHFDKQFLKSQSNVMDAYILDFQITSTEGIDIYKERLNHEENHDSESSLTDFSIRHTLHKNFFFEAISWDTNSTERVKYCGLTSRHCFGNEFVRYYQYQEPQSTKLYSWPIVNAEPAITWYLATKTPSHRS